MRIASACPPNIGARIAGFGTNTCIGFPGGEAHHTDFDIRVLFLKQIGHLLTDHHVGGADHIQFPGSLSWQGRECCAGGEDRHQSNALHGVLLGCVGWRYVVAYSFCTCVQITRG
ncbi:hypothetical protein D3C71_1532840 [compost metagenome]